MDAGIAFSNDHAKFIKKFRIENFLCSSTYGQ